MKNKGLIVSIVLLVLLGGYFVLFRGCKEEAMQITCKLRPARKGAPTQRGVTPMYDVAFGFNKRYRLSLLKVVAAADLATNKYPVPLWHLVPDAKPAAVKAVTYGRPVPGMKPAVADLEPQALEPNIEYVLLVEAGKIHSHTNFIARERPVQR